MDYKFAILLVVLVILIFVVIREIASVKEEINNQSKNTKALFLSLDQKMNLGFNNCVNKTKVIMGDYMVQIRKMSEFGSQQIIATTSNGYSDSESLKHSSRPRIPYLSENENIEKKQEIKQNFQVDLSCRADQASAKKHSTKSEDHRASATKRVTENENKVTESQTKASPTFATKESALPMLHESTESSDDFDQHISIESNIINGGSELDSQDNEEEEEEKEEEEEEVEEEKNEKKITLNIRKDDDLESVVTVDMGTALDILEGLEKRKKSELEEIARRYLIPTTYKEGSMRKQYKRDELCDLIKNKLEQIIAAGKQE